jgi:hypothetical protein
MKLFTVSRFILVTICVYALNALIVTVIISCGQNVTECSSCSVLKLMGVIFRRWQQAG